VLKIFVTGGSGLLGCKVVEIATKRGHEVTFGYHNNKRDFGVKIDLVVDGGLDPIYFAKPDAIIHTAGLTNVDNCEIERALAYEVNVEGTRKVAEIANRLGCFLVNVSTDYVFPGRRGGMYKEDDKPHPVSYYGYTKLMSESFCDSIARSCVIYGSVPSSGKENNFVLWIIKNIEHGDKVNVVIDQFITPVLNINLADMLLEVVEERLEGTINLAGAERISRYDFALRVADKFKLDRRLICPVRMRDIHWVARRPKDASLDTAKASMLLKRKPLYLDEALNLLESDIKG
jgi:dTDP-4-dehydrorhamnose reductase